VPYFVYILECAGGSFYVGRTWDPGLRLQQHNDGLGGAYTVKRRPVTLAYLEEYDSEPAAIGRERQLKNWTHDRKAALISGDLATLRNLSRRRVR